MLINSNDLMNTYSGKLSEKTISPSTIELEAEWLNNSLLPRKIKEKTKFCNIKCIFLFEYAALDLFEKAYSNFCKDIKECDLKFDDISFNYHCFISSIGDYERIGLYNYLFEANWIGYKYETMIIETANKAASKTINVTGNTTTPAIVEITPSINIIDIVITGVSEVPMTIKNLTAGNKVTIDGELGTVTQNGTNKYGDTDMWEFPRLVPGANTISFSQSNCDITIKYKPRWI